MALESIKIQIIKDFSPSNMSDFFLYVETATVFEFKKNWVPAPPFRRRYTQLLIGSAEDTPRPY